MGDGSWPPPSTTDPTRRGRRYRHTSYQKQTKNQWARDDPAFVVVCCLLLSAASAAYCATFSRSLWHSMLSVLSAVVVDFLLIGLATSSTCWCAGGILTHGLIGHVHTPQRQR
jgi:hypothetical protein